MKSQAGSRITLLRRWLMNSHVKVWVFYKKVLEHVFVGWNSVSATIILDGVMGKPEMVVVMTSQIACRARLREYAWRMSIQQSFRDDKSGGFDLEHTRLQHVERVNRLLLASAIATLWCHELGEFVLKRGDELHCHVDPSFQRTLSLFRLGFRWLKRVIATTLHSLPAFQATLSNLCLKPVVIQKAIANV